MMHVALHGRSQRYSAGVMVDGTSASTTAAQSSATRLSQRSRTQKPIKSAPQESADRDQVSAWSPAPVQALPEAIGTAVVIGAGASGLVTALQLARFGMQVQVRVRTRP